LCARFIQKMNENAHLYARTGEWKLRLGPIEIDNIIIYFYELLEIPP